VKAIPVVCRIHFPSGLTLSHRKSESLGKDLQELLKKYLAEKFYLTYTVSLVPVHVSDDKYIQTLQTVCSAMFMCIYIYNHIYMYIYNKNWIDLTLHQSLLLDLSKCF
jgi:hypothetical protein